MLLGSCTKTKPPVSPEAAINSLEQCQCADLPKPKNEYELIGVVTGGDLQDNLQFCMQNELVSVGTIELINIVADESSIIYPMPCACPQIPDNLISSIGLIETEYLLAISAAVFECEANLEGQLDPDNNN